MPDRATQVAILGAGVMGETILSGLVRAGRAPETLLVGEKRPERAEELRERYGVEVVANREAARRAETVMVVVKPQDMGDLLAEIAQELRPGQLVVSLAAGITTAFIESHLPDGVAVVRVMPNTPALVDEGMAAISRGSHCDEDHLLEAESLLAATGRVLRVPERQRPRPVRPQDHDRPAMDRLDDPAALDPGQHWVGRVGDQVGRGGTHVGRAVLTWGGRPQRSASRSSTAASPSR